MKDKEENDIIPGNGARILLILFGTDMVRALLDGRKTVTRRVVKFPANYNPKWTGYVPDGSVLYGSNNIPAAKSPYQLGDILYVRETWAKQQGLYWHKAGLEVDKNGRDEHGTVVPQKGYLPSICPARPRGFSCG